MTLPERELWLCRPCHEVSLNTSSDNRDAETRKLSPEQSINSSDIFAKLEDISTQLGKLLEVPGKIEKIENQLTIISENNQDIQSHLVKTDEIVALIETENKNLKEEVAKLRATLNENLQYQHLNNVIISNIPQANPNEDEKETMELVKKLLTELDVKFNPWELIRAHRLTPRKCKVDDHNDQGQQEPPAIIAKLWNVPLKKTVILASISKKPKASIFGGRETTRIYLNDNLAPETQALFGEARYRLVKQPSQELKFYSVSHRDGKIIAKKTSTSRPVRIISRADIDRLSNTIT